MNSSRKRAAEKRSAWLRISLASKKGSASSKRRTASTSASLVLRVEEDTRRVGGRIRRPGERTHGLERTAASERDHRTPRRLRLQRRDPEVFLLRIHECAAARVQLRQLGLRHAPAYVDAGERAALERGSQRSVAHDDETAAERSEGLDREIRALVGDEGADEQIEIVGRTAVGAKRVDVDGRVDDLRVATPVAARALAHVLRDRDETRHPLGTGGRAIEAAQPREQRRGERAAQPATQIDVRRVPRVAHRGQAVTEMPGAGGDACCLGHRVVHRDDEVVAVDAELSHRPGQQREQLAVVTRRARPALQRTRVDPQGVDARSRRSRHVHQREEVRGREESREFVEHALAAAQSGQPVVDERYAHLGAFLDGLRPGERFGVFGLCRPISIQRVERRLLCDALGSRAHASVRRRGRRRDRRRASATPRSPARAR